MGVDLKVMASSFRDRPDEFLPTATLRFERDPALFAALAVDADPALARPLPGGLKVGVYDDGGLTFVVGDRHGRPLTYTTPADLRQLRIPAEFSPWNRAVLAFLLTLPADTRLVLYWC